MENNMEVPQKVENKTTILSSNLPSGYVSKGIEINTPNVCMCSLMLLLYHHSQ
jgi:hypothetical protein